MNSREAVFKARAGRWICHLPWLCLSLFLLSACATRPYHGTQVDSSSFLDRAITQQDRDLIVTVAVPDAEETIELTGLDLYEQGIQPVWLKVENRGDSKARVAMWSIDREYFSPIEVAYMNRKKFSKQGYVDMEKWFYQNGLPRNIPAGETRTGLVFTHLRAGTKGFNLVAFSNGTASDFTFFVPLKGFVADFMEVDFANLYAESEFRDVDQPTLKEILENELPCCTDDPAGELKGGPINVVLVGTGMAVRRAMVRGSWLETSVDEKVAIRARKQQFNGRRPDAIFSQLREDGNERIQIHLWMTPWRVNQEPVWVGEVFYYTEDKSFLSLFSEEAIEDSKLLSSFARESVTADVDSAQQLLLQNLWYNGSLRLVGFTTGVGVVSMDEPRTGFGGVAYFTDGYRLVVFLSEDILALDEGRYIYDFMQRGFMRNLGQ